MTLPLNELVPGVEKLEGENLVYLVQSLSRLRIKHRVDLSLYGGQGGCGCERFEMKIGPALERGATPTPRLECRHIQMAKRHYYWENILMDIDRIRSASEANRWVNYGR
jgi:hypothetical protein